MSARSACPPGPLSRPSAQFHAGLKIDGDGNVYHADMPASKVQAQKAGIAAAAAIEEERKREAAELEGTEAEDTMKEAAALSEARRKRQWEGKAPQEGRSVDKRSSQGKKRKFVEM